MSRHLSSLLVLCVAAAFLAGLIPASAQTPAAVTIQYLFTGGDNSTFYLESSFQPVETAPSLSYDDGTTVTGGNWSYNGRGWYSYIQSAKCGQAFRFSMQGNPDIQALNLTSLGVGRFIITESACLPVIRVIAVNEAAPGQNIAVYGFKFAEGYLGSHSESDFRLCFEDPIGQSTCSSGASIQVWKDNSIRANLPPSLTPGTDYTVTVVRGSVSSLGKSYRVGINSFPQGSNRMIVGYDGPDTNRVYAIVSQQPQVPTRMIVTYNGQSHTSPWLFDGIDWFGHVETPYCNRDFTVSWPSPSPDQFFFSGLTQISGNHLLTEPGSCRPNISGVYQPSSAVPVTMVDPGDSIGLVGANFLNGRTGTGDNGLTVQITGPNSEQFTISKGQSQYWYDTYIGTFTLPASLQMHTRYQLTVFRDGVSSRPVSLLVGPYRTFLPALTR